MCCRKKSMSEFNLIDLHANHASINKLKFIGSSTSSVTLNLRNFSSKKFFEVKHIKNF
jgi:hypothetical protein